MSISSFFNKTSLLTGRINSPDDVFSSTTQTILSFPSKTFVIRPIGHRVGGVFSSLIITTSLMSIFGCPVCHFFRCCKFETYSVDHFFQKSVIRWSILFFCRVNEIVSFPVVFGSGNAVIGRPIKNCPGVSAKASLGSFETDVIGLEFKIASICVNSVVKSSKNNFVLPMLRYMWRFKDLTAASHSPPKFGVLGGIVSQVKLFSLPNVDIKSSNSCVAQACRNSNSPLVPMKVVELSLYISSGIPRRDTNLLMDARQSSLVRDITGSM